MEVVVTFECIDAKKETTKKEIEEDLNKSINEIGWTYTYEIKSVELK